MRALVAVAFAAMNLLFLLPSAAADAMVQVEPDYLRLSSQRDYPVTIDVDVEWVCDRPAPPEGRPRMAPFPSRYEQDLGLVWKVEPEYIDMMWSSGTDPNGQRMYFIHESLEVVVRRVGQPFDAVTLNVQWSVGHVNVGDDCVAGPREQTGIWADMTIDVPIIADTHEPQNSPGLGFASLLGAGAAAGAMHALHLRRR